MAGLDDDASKLSLLVDRGVEGELPPAFPASNDAGEDTGALLCSSGCVLVQTMADVGSLCVCEY